MTDVTIQHRAFQFSLRVVQCLQKEGADHLQEPLRKQLIRSATSIGANIIEGQNCSSKKAFLQYRQIAYRSSKETEYWLQLLTKTHISYNKAEYQTLLDENIQISKILSTILIQTKKNA